MKYKLCLFISLLSLGVCAQNTGYQEKYRPQFHYSSAKNWINDPNGLLYENGQYHLFYQYNPFGTKWGHMSWGHAVSKDLTSWQELPVALMELKDTMIFSGSAVVDKNNTAGFTNNSKTTTLVAIYTAHQENIKQAQHLAYSNDNGQTWSHYNNNPVLDMNKKDFRDPQVSWYEKGKKWVMAVSEPHPHQISFYESADLKAWKFMSAFGPLGDTSGVWECPALLEVPFENDPSKKKWVLLLSQNSSMQYFVGDFDGERFVNENPPTPVMRPDYGPDYYAAITYNNLPASFPPVSIGWINSWNYANDIPTSTWRGAMSLPRELSLKKTGFTWRLIQKPVPSLKKLRGAIGEPGLLEVSGSKAIPFRSNQFEMEITIDISSSENAGIILAKGGGHETRVGYDKKKKTLYLDRSKSGEISFSKNFSGLYEVPIIVAGNKLKLHLFFDKSIVEVFANEGDVTITAQVFPDEADNEIEFFSTKGKARIEDLKYWPLKSIWK